MTRGGTPQTPEATRVLDRIDGTAFASLSGMRRAALLLSLGACACGAYTGTPSTTTLTPSATEHEAVLTGYGIDPAENRPSVPPSCESIWDTNEDGVLSSSEIAAGLEQTWDLNRDGELEPAELAAAVETLPGPMRARIAELEIRAGPNGLAAFHYWDGNQDGVIEPDELTPAMVARWDVDGDGVIEPNEWPVG